MIKNDNHVVKPGSSTSSDYKSAFDLEANMKAVGTISTANATDLNSAIALVNELKAKFNALIEGI